MKNLIYSTVAVFGVVGTSLADRPVELKDFLVCSSHSSTGICDFQTTTSWSSMGEIPAPAGIVVYTGTSGTLCGSIHCPRWNGRVFVNE